MEKPANHADTIRTHKPKKKIGQKKRSRGHPTVKACKEPPVMMKGNAKKGTIKSMAPKSPSMILHKGY
jgi:hypothetical protein